MTEIKNKLAEVRKNKGLSQRKLAELSGLSHGHIGDIEKGRTNLNSNTIAILAKALNITPEELKEDSLIHNDKVSLKIYTHSLSAGKGLPPKDYETHSLVEIDRELLEFLTKVNPNNLILFFVQGDSMSPKIEDKDILLVDYTINQIQFDGIYAISYDNELYVKRVQRMPDKILLHSLNPDYETIEIPLPPKFDLKIIGKVVCTLFKKL